jgi:murein DD-endopeptidase MepM/ murein hydrolase activator NlpD
VTWPRRGGWRSGWAGFPLLAVVSLLLLDLALASQPAAASGQGQAAPSAKRTARAQPAKKPQARAGDSAPRATARASVPRPGSEQACVHVVQRGEALSRVAARYGVSRQSLIASNQIGGNGGVKVGQRLGIPGCKGRGAPRARTPVEPAVIMLEDGLLLTRVGPDRIPTRLFVAVPEFGADSIEFGWPVDGVLASAFGRRRTGWHAGIDIQVDLGTPVVAAASGTVIFSGWAASYGRAVKLQHANGFVTIYAHNNENLVQVGDVVEAGGVVATAGRSGHASGSHLHFEIRREGMAFNPLYLLEARDTTPVLVSSTPEHVGVVEPFDEDADEDIGHE